MSILILDEQTRRTPIGQKIDSATEPVIEIQDDTGRMVARIELAAQADPAIEAAVLEIVEREQDELRRRMHSDPAFDITTAELLAQARAAADRAGN